MTVYFCARFCLIKKEYVFGVYFQCYSDLFAETVSQLPFAVLRWTFY